MGRALQNKAYRDPARILQERQDKTCLGCYHELKLPNSGRLFCAKLMPHGKRCVYYKENYGGRSGE